MDYLKNRGDNASGPLLWRELAYSDRQLALFIAVFSEITWAMDWGEDTSADDGLVELGVYTGVGNVNVENVAQILAAGRRVERPFWSLFYATVYEAYIVDLLTLRYEALDTSKPAFRALTACSYGIGFIFLFVPTLKTVMIILLSLISP